MIIKKISHSIFFSFLLAVILLGGINKPLKATGGKIAGTVTDANTGKPLVGVNIVLEGTTIGTASDFDGEYFILNISPGTYTIVASMIGYKKTFIENVEVSINHTTQLDISLQEVVLEIDQEVVVSAERPLIQKDQTSSRHYVDATEISTQPAEALSQILNTLPGIDTDPTGQLTVRRGSIDQVSFLIDGVRARNPLNFDPYTNINLTSIKEMEVITGGFKAEYGEAQSGVFNIVTKEGGEKFQSYAELRWTPPGLRHWGTSFYDYSTPKYWENTHARHLQWWIDHPDQWIDPDGNKGNDPNAIWSPEEAYANYMKTHQPMTEYTDRSTYQTEISLGGPMYFDDLSYFVSFKYRQAPPVMGNSYRDLGKWYDGFGKLTYQLSQDVKLMFSGYFSQVNSNYGMEYMPAEADLEEKYAYINYYGYPESREDAQTIKLTHVLSGSSFYELQLTRHFTYRSQDVFPNDPDGWETGGKEFDNLRAKDSSGAPIPGGYQNIIGLHTTGYYYRGNDHNTDYTFSGDYTNQVNTKWELKSGFDFTYYILDRFQEAKAYHVIEEKVYEPYEGAFYVDNKLEFEGLIINAGLRYDFYNLNDTYYENEYDPFGTIEETEPETSSTKTTGQLSPRLGISHPISENTVLHFSYGHFFQRPPFGNYGEGSGIDADGHHVTGSLNTYLIKDAEGNITPYNLGNRNLKPRKTVQYELGIEHNFGGIVADVTGFYKDITNTIRTVRVFMSDGNSYLTTGNSDYQDAKGVEISLRKPFSGYWGGYLNYTWSTGIAGRSGDPDVIAAPTSGVQTRITDEIGDFILYDPPRLKFGIVFGTPNDFDFLGGILSGMQVSFHAQIYYPHENIISHNYGIGGGSYIKPPDRNVKIGLRKEIDIAGITTAFFIEVFNAFNDRHINLSAVNPSNASYQDIVKYVNSRFSVYPQTSPDGSPYPDYAKYNNLPRTIVFGFALEVN